MSNDVNAVDQSSSSSSKKVSKVTLEVEPCDADTPMGLARKRARNLLVHHGKAGRPVPLWEVNTG